MKTKGSGPQGNLAPDFYFIVRQAAIDPHGHLFTTLSRDHFVDEMDVVFRAVQFGERHLAGVVGRFDLDIYLIVVDRQSTRLGSEIPLQIIPLPAVAEKFRAEIALVPDDVPSDGAHPSLIEIVAQLDQGSPA